jgi:hypothetical protein
MITALYCTSLPVDHVLSDLCTLVELLNNPRIKYSFPKFFVALCFDWLLWAMLLMFCLCCDCNECMIWVIGLVIPAVRCSVVFWQLNQGDVVRTLLSCGADPGVLNARGLHAVDVATSEQMQQIYIEELLRATANSEEVCWMWETVLCQLVNGYWCCEWASGSV